MHPCTYIMLYSLWSPFKGHNLTSCSSITVHSSIPKIGNRFLPSINDETFSFKIYLLGANLSFFKTPPIRSSILILILRPFLRPWSLRGWEDSKKTPMADGSPYVFENKKRGPVTGSWTEYFALTDELKCCQNGCQLWVKPWLTAQTRDAAVCEEAEAAGWWWCELWTLKKSGNCTERVLQTNYSRGY